MTSRILSCWITKVFDVLGRTLHVPPCANPNTTTKGSRCMLKQNKCYEFVLCTNASSFIVNMNMTITWGQTGCHQQAGLSATDESSQWIVVLASRRFKPQSSVPCRCRECWPRAACVQHTLKTSIRKQQHSGIHAEVESQAYIIVFWAMLGKVSLQARAAG